MDVLETLSSRSVSSLKTDLISTKTWRATDSLVLMYPSSAYSIVRVSWNLGKTLSYRWWIVRLNINISKGSPYFCLLWIDTARVKDKTYIWVSVWWKTEN
jgi:hypothetical protein